MPGLTALAAKCLFHVKALRSAPLAYGLLAKSGTPDDIVKSYCRPPAKSSAIRRDVNKFIRSASSEVTMQVATELRSFDRPALLLWTPEDHFFPVSLAKRLCSDLPDARLELIDDAYVFSPEDQPERLAEEIAGFVLQGREQAEGLDSIRALLECGTFGEVA